MLKKHEAFETDLSVHQGRVREIEESGEDLVAQVIPVCCHWRLCVLMYNVNKSGQKLMFTVLLSSVTFKQTRFPKE